MIPILFGIAFAIVVAVIAWPRSHEPRCVKCGKRMTWCDGDRLLEIGRGQGIDAIAVMVRTMSMGSIFECRACETFAEGSYYL